MTTLASHAEHLTDDLEATAAELLRVRSAFLRVARRIDAEIPASPEFDAAVRVVRDQLAAMRSSMKEIQ